MSPPRPPLPLRRPGPPPLSRDDLDALRRLIALARAHLDVPPLDGGRKEALRSGLALAEAVAAWHRRCEPDAYGRQPGGRP